MVRFAHFLVIAILGAAICLASDEADSLYRAGLKAERAGDIVRAYLLYAHAAALEPTNANYASRKVAVQTLAEMTSHETLGNDPYTEPAAAGSIAPPDSHDLIDDAPAPHLEPGLGRKSFDLKGNSRTVFEKVLEAWGLKVIFDKDYQSPLDFSFRISDATFEETLRTLEMASNSFVIAVAPNLAMVARENPQKRQELIPDITVAVPIPSRIAVQEAQEMVTAVQQTFELKRINVDPSRRLVIFRDQESKALAARRLFLELAQMRPQVEVEVEFISLTKQSNLEYGLSLPTSIPLVDFGRVWRSVASVPSGLTQFLTFGGGTTLIGLGITSAEAFATLTRDTANTSLRAEMLTLDGQAATLHVGTRYPIITQGYYGTATGTGTVYTPPPTVSYQDLGLLLKVTPSVEDAGGVSLDVDAEFNVLGPSDPNGQPSIAASKYQGKVRLAADEWAVVAGLVSVNTNVSKNGPIGLSNAPLIGRLFAQTNKMDDRTDALLILKPHIVSLVPADSTPRTIWVGTETRPVSVF